MDELKDELQSKIADYSKMAETGKTQNQILFPKLFLNFSRLQRKDPVF